MDPALLKQRSDFVQRASAVPTVSTSASQVASDVVKRKIAEKKHKPPTKIELRRRAAQAALPKKNTHFDYKSATVTGSANFGVLAKIVDHLKKRHLEQKTWTLSLEEILEELQVFDLKKQSIEWLNEVMPKNHRLTYDEEKKYRYKPVYNIKNSAMLLKLLRQHDTDGTGGVLMSDVQDSVANADKLVTLLGDKVVQMPTSVNKRKDKVLFFNDPEQNVAIDEEFKALWRTVPVDHLDEKKVEDYLQKHGIESIKDLAPKRIAPSAVKRRGVKRRGATIVHNEHLADKLQDYSVQ